MTPADRLLSEFAHQIRDFYLFLRIYCCLAAQPPRLPLGEAVATIGASEPIVVTDEGLNRTE